VAKKKKKKKTKIESNSAYVSCNIHMYATTRLRGEETWAFSSDNRGIQALVCYNGKLDLEGRGEMIIPGGGTLP
jgi:hypothetical protein